MIGNFIMIFINKLQEILVAVKAHDKDITDTRSATTRIENKIGAEDATGGSSISGTLNAKLNALLNGAGQSVIKSIQRGTGSFTDDTVPFEVINISPVSANKSVVLVDGSGYFYDVQSNGTSIYHHIPLQVSNFNGQAFNVELATYLEFRYSAKYKDSASAKFSWQVIEFY